jgi:hypothetical protein
LKLAPDERSEGLRAERQRVLGRGRGDDAAFGDLEARLPRAQLDISTPYRPDQDPAVFRPGDALTAGEAEQPRADDGRAGFLVHLPAQGLLPALTGLGAARGQIPDRAVRADHDDVPAGGHAGALGTMRGPVRDIRRRMP